MTHVVVVGGGLVGALNACFFAKRGFVVDLYESRGDIRKLEVVRGKSINLALSVRGRAALREVGVEDEVIKNGIPMYARMIHSLDGKRSPIPYGKGDQNIMSVDRRLLNEILLSAAEEHDNVTLHFNHKLVKCNFETGECVFKVNGREVSTGSDLIVGNDGAYSTVRQQMMKTTLLDFSQEYIPHGYMELCIPPSKDDKYAMEVNYLHIWPRNKFMMIALPNLDKTYTTTLFMPFDIFNSIQDEHDLRKFFEENFPDSLPLLGWENLKNTYLSSKPLPLVSVKCHPYHVKNKAVIMGDAAHAMVPFYGQGMNCGFEDCLIFDEILSKHNNNLATALPAFTDYRNPDAKAICDLAMYNYIEMRESVNSRVFLARKKIDNFLHWLMPSAWVPLYTMVSFTRTRYHECIEKRKWQDKVLMKVLKGSLTALSVAGLMFTWRYVKEHDITVHLPVVTVSMPKFLTNWS